MDKRHLPMHTKTLPWFLDKTKLVNKEQVAEG
jgi:hypothetical protein